MYKIFQHQSLAEFIDINWDYLNSNVQYHYLIFKLLNDAIEGYTQVHQAVTFIKGSITNVLINTPNITAIFGNSADADFINILSRTLVSKPVAGQLFGGTREILEQLMDKHQTKFEIEKFRVYFECNTSRSVKYAPGACRNARLEDADDLHKMMSQFSHEFDERNIDYTIDQKTVFEGLEKQNIFIWCDANNICSMAQVYFQEEHPYPVIGSVYTKQQFRGKGYVTSLVHTLMQDLLMKNKKILLYTNGYNKVANATFTNLGFVKVGEYIRLLTF